MNSTPVALGAMLLLAACTAHRAYDSNQSLGEQQARCDEKRTEEAAAKCRAAYSRSYEEYQRDLEALGRASGDGTP